MKTSLLIAAMVTIIFSFISMESKQTVPPTPTPPPGTPFGTHFHNSPVQMTEVNATSLALAYDDAMHYGGNHLYQLHRTEKKEPKP